MLALTEHGYLADMTERMVRVLKVRLEAMAAASA